MDWDNARIFLSVARTGQFLAAARALRIDHATVSRRISALETSLNARLFDRRTTGSALTAAGEQFLASAERVEAEMLQVQSGLSPAGIELSGQVRIGAPDGFGTSFLAPRLGGLMDRHPGLTVQLVPLPRAFSLAKREADLAITMERPIEGRLQVRKLTDCRLSLYGSSQYLAGASPINGTADLARHRIISYVPDLLFSEALNYLTELNLPPGPRFECASVVGQLEAVRAGVGIGFLHDYVAAKHPGLERVLPDMSILRSYWLVAHEDVRQLARVRAAYDWIVETVAASEEFV